MRSLARGSFGLLLASAVLAGGACKKGGQERSAAEERELRQSAQVPETVLAYIGVRNPARTLDHLLALGKSFFPLPLDKEALFTLFAQRVGIPPGVMAAIDISGTFWLVVLDGAKTSEADPGVVIFPIRSRNSFEQALAQQMVKTGEEGGLGTYTSKASSSGLLPVRLKIQDKVVIATTSRAALDGIDPVFTRRLAGYLPLHDLTVHLMMEHLARGSGKDLAKKVTGAMKKLRSMAPTQGPIDQRMIAGAAEESLQQYIDLIKSLRDLMITLDVGAKEVTFALGSEGKPGGELQKIIKRQQPGPPFGYKLLPASSWLVLTNLSNPQAKAEWLKIWDHKMNGMFTELDAQDRPLLRAALTTLSTHFTGDISVALHRGIAGEGIAGSLVARVSDAARCREAGKQLMGLVEKWAQRQLRANDGLAPQDWTFKSRQVSWAGAEGAILQVQIAMPSRNRSRLALLMGDTFGLGWVIVGEHALITMGKDTERQLSQMAQGLKRGGRIEGSLADNPAFVQALGGAPDRIGMLYLSLVDLGRWLQGSGLGEIEAIAAALKGAKVRRAPSVDWGVNRVRSQFDVTLRLPIEHFEVFKPILEQYLAKTGSTSIFP